MLSIRAGRFQQRPDLCNLRMAGAFSTIPNPVQSRGFGRDCSGRIGRVDPFEGPAQGVGRCLWNRCKLCGNIARLADMV